MKKIIILLCGFTIIACNDKVETRTNADENAVENSSISLSSKMRGSKDMVEDIYNEILKTDKSLEELDQKINKLQSESDRVSNENIESIGKSKSYYATANNRAKQINDSLLKKETLNLIQISENKFKAKIEKFETLKSQINDNLIKINDEYLAFKIRKTLPEVEAYQNSHPLQINNLNAFINQQYNLLKEIKYYK